MGRVAVLGAGMVGTSAALELRARGREVVLLDRKDPGEETSFGNAGVIARESVVPLNNPALWKALPGYLTNRHVKLRYRMGYLMANARWMVRFLAHARAAKLAETVPALNGLLALSRETHLAWAGEAGIAHHYRTEGWLDIYRDGAALARAAPEVDFHAGLGIRSERLDARALHDLEPHLKPVFAGAIWSRDAATANNPGAVVKGLAAHFAARGGTVRRAAVTGLTPSEGGWRVTLDGGETLEAADVVVALGAWSREVLERLGLRAHLLNERGYHMHYGAEGNAGLTRVVYDVSGGYCLAPMEMGIRLTTGVELAPTDAPPDHSQLRLAEATARTAFPLTARRDPEPWMGRRPTTPDSRPMIGAVPGRPGLWLDYGHQHIGFTTGPGSAKLLADLMDRRPPAIDPAPFRPGRFGR